MTYTRLVLHLAQKHGGSEWLDYDHTFQAQAASSPDMAWNAINPSLMASAVLSSTSTGMFCHLCQEVDHQATDCTLAAFDLTPNPAGLPQTPSGPTGLSATIYLLKCAAGLIVACRFRHVCPYPEPPQLPESLHALFHLPDLLCLCEYNKSTCTCIYHWFMFPAVRLDYLMFSVWTHYYKAQKVTLISTNLHI